MGGNDVAPCLACERLAAAIAFHAAAAEIGNAPLIVATRSIVRLLEAEVDRRHTRAAPGGESVGILNLDGAVGYQQYVFLLFHDDIDGGCRIISSSLSRTVGSGGNRLSSSLHAVLIIPLMGRGLLWIYPGLSLTASWYVCSISMARLCKCCMPARYFSLSSSSQYPAPPLATGTPILRAIPTKTRSSASEIPISAAREGLWRASGDKTAIKVSQCCL
jgi:hypothetical protein